MEDNFGYNLMQTLTLCILNTSSKLKLTQLHKTCSIYNFDFNAAKYLKTHITDKPKQNILG